MGYMKGQKKNTHEDAALPCAHTLCSTLHKVLGFFNEEQYMMFVNPYYSQKKNK